MSSCPTTKSLTEFGHTHFSFLPSFTYLKTKSLNNFSGPFQISDSKMFLSFKISYLHKEIIHCTKEFIRGFLYLVSPSL